MLGVSVRTLERWRHDATSYQRRGPHQRPANALTAAERATLLATVNSSPCCDLSPHQVVPRLADAGPYLASVSTMYFVLRTEQPLAHRGRAVVPQRRATPSHEVTGPNQVWSLNITDLKSPVRGMFWHLYLILHFWSQKFAGWTVEGTERSAHAAAEFRATCTAAIHDPPGLVLHADNGGPTKGATMPAILEPLGVLASFSRPSVSNDDSFSEALSRTAKYRPHIPHEPFTDKAHASA